MKTALKVFVIHLIVILLTMVFVYRNAFHMPGMDLNSEAFLVWAAFLFFDFPCSIIVMITSGPGVVGVPEFVRGGIWVSEILWPGLVFQTIGTINWIIIAVLYKKFMQRKIPLDTDTNAPHPNPLPRGEGTYDADFSREARTDEVTK